MLLCWDFQYEIRSFLLIFINFHVDFCIFSVLCFREIFPGFIAVYFILEKRFILFKKKFTDSLINYFDGLVIYFCRSITRIISIKMTQKSSFSSKSKVRIFHVAFNSNFVGLANLPYSIEKSKILHRSVSDGIILKLLKILLLKLINC